MADFTDIIQEINTNIADNNTQAITAAKLRTTLIDLTNTIEDQQDGFEVNITEDMNDFIVAATAATHNFQQTIVDNLTSTDANKALSAKQGKILNEKIQDLQLQINNEFVPVKSENLYMRGTINSSGTLNENTSGSIYRYQISQGEKVVVWISGGSTAYAALTFSTNAETLSTTMIMMNTGSAGYYAYKAPSDGYVFICVATSQTSTIKFPKTTELNEFGVYKYTYGENAIESYVGSDLSDTALWGDGFLDASGTVNSTTSYKYTKTYFRILPGKYFQAGYVVSGNARTVFYDENKNVIGSSSSGNATGTLSKTAPANSFYVRFCMSSTSTSRLALIFQDEGSLLVNVPEINDLDNRVDNLENAMTTIDKSIDNNLLNEANLVPSNWTIYNGTTTSIDNYGNSNVKYRIPIDNSAKVIHVKFRFKTTQTLGASSSSTNHPLLTCNSSTYYTSGLRQTSPIYNTDAAMIQRSQYFVAQNGSNVSNITLDDVTYKTIHGDIAYSLEYKGTSYSSFSSYRILIASNRIEIQTSGGTAVETINVDTGETVGSVVEKVNANSDYLKAVWYRDANLPFSYCWNSTSATLPLTFSSYSRPWMIWKTNDDKWHNFEAVLDFNLLKSWTNIDGATVERTITEPSTKTLTIGGTMTSSFIYSMAPFLFRDLHIGYGYEDAEVITYPNNVTGTITRLISNDSPYLMIFEGHSIDVEMNKNMPTGQDTYMATSTDTLRTVFTELRKKGFVPVNWNDIIQWKKYNKKLPKRCYTLMFDDFQIENYMVLAKRIPFVEFGVTPGLAIITGQNGTTRSRSEEVTIDGVTWTLGEVFDAMIKSGWFPCSHTKNHTEMTQSNVPDSKLLSFCKTCIQSCEKLGIYDNIIVYPKGTANSWKKLAMTVSGFAIGVQIANNGYNSLESMDFNLIRNEIGSRKNINDILAQIV